MGVFDRLRGISDPVDGEYRLVACSMNSGGAVYENCTMDGVVVAGDVGPVSVHHVCIAAPTAKWPQPGQTLPVTVDRKNPERLKIRWDRVPTNAELARAAAQQAAAAAGGAAPTPTPGMPADVSAMVGDIVARARAAGATVTTNVETSVVGAPGRAVPGAAGGGLTPEQAAQASAGGASALGLTATTARLLAAHQITLPPGMPSAPGGVWDLTLDITANPGYTAVLRISFSTDEKRSAIAQVGRQLPVLVDPANHDRVAIDTSRL